MMYACEECKKECDIRWCQDDNGRGGMHFESWLSPMSRCCDCIVRVVPEDWEKEPGASLRDYREASAWEDYYAEERSYYDDRV